MTLAQLSTFLKGQSSGFPTIEDLSSNSATSAYVNPLDIPETEKIPSSSSPNTSYTAFHKKTVGWAQSGVSIAEINISDNPMNFRYISTPETTLGIVYAYDERNPDKAPINGMNRVRDIIQEVSDNVIFKLNSEATAAGFLADLQNGISNYRFVIFFEFSHGSSEHITLKGGLGKQSVLNKLISAKNRIFGMFDSCHSESMINSSSAGANKYMQVTYGDNYKITPTKWEKRGNNPIFKAASNPSENDTNDGNESIVDFLIDGLEREFEKAPQTRQLMGSTPSSVVGDKPLVMLWSSTGAENYGWYYPGSNTVFAAALGGAWEDQKNNRYVNKNESSGFWESTQSRGTTHWGKPSDINSCKPCMRTFEPGNDDYNKFVYLFAMR